MHSNVMLPNHIFICWRDLHPSWMLAAESASELDDAKKIHSIIRKLQYCITGSIERKRAVLDGNFLRFYRDDLTSRS